MQNTSLLEMLEKEKHICHRIQDVTNMMLGLTEAAKEGRTKMDDHSSLIHRLVSEAEAQEAALKECRMDIARRVDDLFAMSCTGGAV
jgi:hypothetical protein